MGARLRMQALQSLRGRNPIFHNLTLISIPGGVDSTTTKVKEISYASEKRLLKENNQQQYSSRSNEW